MTGNISGSGCFDGFFESKNPCADYGKSHTITFQNCYARVNFSITGGKYDV